MVTNNATTKRTTTKRINIKSFCFEVREKLFFSLTTFSSFTSSTFGTISFTLTSSCTIFLVSTFLAFSFLTLALVSTFFVFCLLVFLF